MIVGECNVGSSKPARELMNSRITSSINGPSSSSSAAIGAAVPTVILSEGGNFNDLAELSREINDSMTALKRDNPSQFAICLVSLLFVLVMIIAVVIICIVIDSHHNS
jgi:ABC-type transport system involved in multi-copper enzyme maturation permease subunit